MIVSATDTRMAIVASRITRLEERPMGPLWVGSEVASEIASSHVGLFIGGMGGAELMISRIRYLSDYEDGRWLVVPATKDLSQITYETFERDGLPTEGDPAKGPWKLGNLELATPEQLRKVDPKDVEGVLLLDPRCIVHKAREFRMGNGSNHDRPQLIVNFLATAWQVSASPPLFGIMTNVRAKSASSKRMAEVYCLNGWQFVDGASVAFGRVC